MYSISFENNSFTDASADAFIDALQHNTSLESLELWGNFSDDKKAAIRAAGGKNAYGGDRVYVDIVITGTGPW